MPSTKRQLLSATSVCFQAFLVGTWHYVLLNRPDNLRDRGTIDGWQPTYSVTLIESVHSVTVAAAPEEPEMPEDSVSDPFEESDERGNASAGSTTQMLDHPTVFNQYGNNGVQIGDVGSLVIRHDHKEK